MRIKNAHTVSVTIDKPAVATLIWFYTGKPFSKLTFKDVDIQFEELHDWAFEVRDNK